jgi:hypothetical protein
VIEVNVKINPEDMPGRPLRRIKCDSCDEYVQDLLEEIAGELTTE